MYSENEPAMKWNVAVLNKLPDELEVKDKIQDNYKYPLRLIKPAQNQKQTNIGGLSKLLS